MRDRARDRDMFGDTLGLGSSYSSGLAYMKETGGQKERWGNPPPQRGGLPGSMQQVPGRKEVGEQERGR